MEHPLINLRAARVNANLTQKKAAMMLNISEATLQNYESGKTFPQMDMVEKISVVYNFPKDYICFGKRRFIMKSDATTCI